MGTKQIISKEKGLYYYANGGKIARNFGPNNVLGCATDISNLNDPDGFILFKKNNESFVVKSKYIKLGLDCKDDDDSKGDDSETSEGTKNGSSFGLGKKDGIIPSKYLIYILGGLVIYKILD